MSIDQLIRYKYVSLPDHFSQDLHIYSSNDRPLSIVYLWQNEPVGLIS